jgi:quercetin dioxygenase-like cupin family protein
MKQQTKAFKTMTTPETPTASGALKGASGSPAHAVNAVRLLASGPKVQAREFLVEPGQQVRWHSHTQLTDWCFCLEGVVIFEAADLERKVHQQVLLQEGEHCVIEPGIIHRLRNGSSALCRYLLVQSGEKYDFNQATHDWLPA